MNDITETNLRLVAKCGLYCGNCFKFKKGKCSGCETNEKASWCKIRKCCIEHGYHTCADCAISNPRECKNHSNIISSFFELVFRSDRKASIEYIKENGAEAFVQLMIDQNRMVIKK